MKFTYYDSEFGSDYHKSVLIKYKDTIEKLEKLSENSTIKELEDVLDGTLLVVLGDNCSGVDIANLTNEWVVEWTW